MRYFIGDVHGCADTLYTLIDNIKPTKADQVRFVGDLVDRGTQSKSVIDFIMEWQNRGYDWQCVMGNHELMMLDALNNDNNPSVADWIRNGGLPTLQSFGNNIEEKYLVWLENLPQYIIDTDYILVHAGLNFLYPDPVLHMINSIGRLHRTYDHLWVRDFVVKPEVLCGKVLIHGHNPIPLEGILNPEPSCINVDNGCVYAGSCEDFGNLVAYNLDTEKFIVQPFVY